MIIYQHQRVLYGLCTWLTDGPGPDRSGTLGLWRHHHRKWVLFVSRALSSASKHSLLSWEDPPVFQLLSDVRGTGYREPYVIWVSCTYTLYTLLEYVVSGVTFRSHEPRAVIDLSYWLQSRELFCRLLRYGTNIADGRITYSLIDSMALKLC